MFGITAFSEAPFSDLGAVNLIAESVTASDAATSTVIFTPRSVSESGSATDASAVALGATGAITETATAGSAATSLVVFASGITESAGATDQQSATVIYASAKTESVTATSSEYAGYTYVDSIIEYANALDTVMRIQKWYPVASTSTTWTDEPALTD